MCGICGEPIDDHDGPGAHEGQRVTYEIVERRNTLVLTRAIDTIVDERKMAADTLIRNLKLDADSLVGRRFTCVVTPVVLGNWIPASGLGLRRRMSMQLPDIR